MDVIQRCILTGLDLGALVALSRANRAWNSLTAPHVERRQTEIIDALPIASISIGHPLAAPIHPGDDGKRILVPRSPRAPLAAPLFVMPADRPRDDDDQDDSVGECRGGGGGAAIATYHADCLWMTVRYLPSCTESPDEWRRRMSAEFQHCANIRCPCWRQTGIGCLGKQWCQCHALVPYAAPATLPLWQPRLDWVRHTAVTVMCESLSVDDARRVTIGGDQYVWQRWGRLVEFLEQQCATMAAYRSVTHRRRWAQRIVTMACVLWQSVEPWFVAGIVRAVERELTRDLRVLRLPLQHHARSTEAHQSGDRRKRRRTAAPS